VLTVRYRRSKTPGTTYFFTVVTYRRRPILCEPDTIALRREAFKTVKQRHPCFWAPFVVVGD
jgi:putative transposase